MEEIKYYAIYKSKDELITLWTKQYNKQAEVVDEIGSNGGKQPIFYKIVNGYHIKISIYGEEL